MTESQYETRSDDAISNAWAEYEGRAWLASMREYTAESRVYYVDDDLVVAVTDGFRHCFITCFHEHPGGRHVSRATMPTVGQRRLEYKRRLEAEVKGRMIIDLQRVRGV